MVIGLIYLFIDNPAHLLARLRQEEVVITPTSTNLGSGQVGDTREVEVLFTNTTDQPVRIYGGSADCNCVKTDALPFTILPHGEQSITIKITFVGNPGRVQHRFTFLTDSKQKQVITRFAMQIVELPKADGISGIQVNDGHQLGFVVEE